MLKKILIALLLLTVVIGFGAYYVLRNIDSITKDIIEESGSEVLGTVVSVGAVQVQLSKGIATINDLSVANPSGYSENPAIRFAELTAEIEITTGIVKQIYSSQPEIRVEFRGAESNFQVFSKNIKASAEENASAEEKQPESGERQPGKDPSLVQINQVVVEQAKATVTMDDDKSRELTIDRLEFVNLRGSPQQITRVVLGQFIEQVLKAVARQSLEDKANQILEEQGGEIMNKLKNLIN